MTDQSKYCTKGNLVQSMIFLFFFTGVAKRSMGEPLLRRSRAISTKSSSITKTPIQKWVMTRENPETFM